MDGRASCRAASRRVLLILKRDVEKRDFKGSLFLEAKVQGTIKVHAYLRILFGSNKILNTKNNPATVICCKKQRMMLHR